MKVKPRGKYVLIKQDDEGPRASEYGIVAPASTETEQKAFGTVVGVGPEVKDLKRGDRVIYGKYAGEELEIEERGKAKSHRLMEEEFVIAFLVD